MSLILGISIGVVSGIIFAFLAVKFKTNGIKKNAEKDWEKYKNNEFIVGKDDEGKEIKMGLDRFEWLAEKKKGYNKSKYLNKVKDDKK